MSNIVDLEKLFHRSKDRIKDLGEVFTPESYVEDMLDLLAKDKRGLWSDEEISFFEPCAGHGNIVLTLFKRRLEGIYKKAIAQGIGGKSSEAPFYAVSNALNTLWAIDIDPKNVENCRSRVFAATLSFLKSKLRIENDAMLISKRKDFFAHVLAATMWHIDENETLSALSNSETAKLTANNTRPGAKWFSKRGHNPINFDLTWVNYFVGFEAKGITPLEFGRSLRFIESTLSGSSRGFDDFEFARSVVESNKTNASSSKSIRPESVGA